MTPAERLAILKKIASVATFSKRDFCRVLIVQEGIRGTIGTGDDLDEAIDSAYESLRNRVWKEIHRR